MSDGLVIGLIDAKMAGVALVSGNGNSISVSAGSDSLVQ